MNRKERFLNFLEKFKDLDYGFIGVLIKIPNQDKPELIVNLPDSLYSKINYFKYNYDENLNLIANPEVTILKYSFTTEFENLNTLFKEEF